MLTIYQFSFVFDFYTTKLRVVLLPSVSSILLWLLLTLCVQESQLPQDQKAPSVTAWVIADLGITESVKNLCWVHMSGVDWWLKLGISTWEISLKWHMKAAIFPDSVPSSLALKSTSSLRVV